MIQPSEIPAIAIGGYAGGFVAVMLLWEKGLLLSGLYGTFGAIGAVILMFTLTAFNEMRRASRETNRGEDA